MIRIERKIIHINGLSYVKRADFVAPANDYIDEDGGSWKQVIVIERQKYNHMWE